MAAGFYLWSMYIISLHVADGFSLNGFEIQPQRMLKDQVNYMFCSAEDPDCTTEFRLNDPDGRCVNRTIVDVEDLRNH